MQQIETRPRLGAHERAILAQIEAARTAGVGGRLPTGGATRPPVPEKAANGKFVPFERSEQSLIERFVSKIDFHGPIPVGREQLGRCWVWTGALSQSGHRAVFYPVIREGVADNGRRWKIWRANRLSLLVYGGWIDVAEDVGEPLIDWLRRADRWYAQLAPEAPLEASHDCDNSVCVNPAHLSWEPHWLNVNSGTVRARGRRQRYVEDLRREYESREQP